MFLVFSCYVGVSVGVSVGVAVGGSMPLTVAEFSIDTGSPLGDLLWTFSVLVKTGLILSH
jgi:hypothetical protein